MKWLKYLIGVLGGALGSAWVAGKERRLQGAVVGGVTGAVMGHIFVILQEEAPGLIEGDYNSYVLKWKAPFVIPGRAGGSFALGSYITENEKYAYLFTLRDLDGGYQPLMVLDMETGELVNQFKDAFFEMIVKDVTGSANRYCVITDVGLTWLRILKDGELLQLIPPENIPPGAGYDYWWGVAMTRSGRRFVVGYYDDSENVSEIRCYEGSSEPPPSIPVPTPTVSPILPLGNPRSMFGVRKQGVSVKAVPCR